MNYRWYSGLSRDWRNAGLDWLCLRRSEGERIKAIELEEGTHHFFEELYVLNSSASDPRDFLVSNRILSEAAPVGFDQEELNQEDWDTLLIRCRFCPRVRAPFTRGAESMEIYFGKIWLPDHSSEPVIHVLVQNPGPGQGPSAPNKWREVADALIGPPVNNGPPWLKLNEGRKVPFLFQLAAPAANDVVIYLLSDERIRPMMIGEEIALSEFPSDCPSVIVPRGAHVPSVAPSRGVGAFAVPVLRKGARGIVGTVLPLVKPISGLNLRTVGDKVYVSWAWDGPPGWVSVELTWGCYGDSVDPVPDSELKYVNAAIFTFLTYQNSSRKMLFTTDDFREWNVRLKATPIVQDIHLDDYALTIDKAF